MGVLSAAAGAVGDAVRPGINFAEEAASGAGDIVKTGVRKGTSPLSVAAGGGTGAYAYGQYTDLQAEEDRTNRYALYQQRLAEIEAMYSNGEISKSEMENLREQATEAYYSSIDDDSSNRGLSFTELVAQMGTIQLVASAAALTFGMYFVARPIARSIAENDISPENLLG